MIQSTIKWIVVTLSVGSLVTIGVCWSIRIFYASDSMQWPLAQVHARELLSRPFERANRQSVQVPEYFPSETHHAWFTAVRLNAPGIVAIESEPYEAVHPGFYRTETRRRHDFPEWSVLSRAPEYDNDDFSRVYSEVAVGWPCIAMSSRLSVGYDGLEPPIGARLDVPIKDRLQGDVAWRGGRKFTALPVRPLVFGFAANTLIYGGACALIWAALRHLIHLRRQATLSRHHLCPTSGCGYPVGDLPSCPECGVAVPTSYPAGVSQSHATA